MQIDDLDNFWARYKYFFLTNSEWIKLKLYYLLSGSLKYFNWTIWIYYWYEYLQHYMLILVELCISTIFTWIKVSVHTYFLQKWNTPNPPIFARIGSANCWVCKGKVQKVIRCWDREYIRQIFETYQIYCLWTWAFVVKPLKL